MKRILLSILILVLLLLSVPMTVQAGSTYYVTKAGNDSTGNGSVGTPWLTIQKCLNTVAAGDTCNIGTGTYSEALKIGVTGTVANRITVQSYNGDVTVNSGSSRTLVTNGRKGYYTFDGIDFVSTMTLSGASNTDATVHMSDGYWDGFTSENGNDGFIFRNCYIEGNMRFYGSDNLVEDCELNGADIRANGLLECYEPSENNIFRRNIIHDYSVRGGWSLQLTDDTLWENNIVYDIGDQGINCDGASSPVDTCDVKNNLIYNVSGLGYGIQLENGFNSTVEGNIIHDVVSGISAINYGPPVSGTEYRDDATNTDYTNNLIYNARDGLICKGSPGGTFTNNTINHTTQTGYWGAIALASYGGYYCPDWTIEYNIVTESSTNAYWYEMGEAGLGTMVSDYNLFDLASGDTKFNWIQGGTNRYTLAQVQSLKGYETHSVLGNASTLAILERTFTYSKFFWLVHDVLLSIYF